MLKVRVRFKFNICIQPGEDKSSAAAAAVKVIPRLVDSTGATPLLSRHVGGLHGGHGGRDSGLDPATWDADDVSSFLGINECATLVESFKEQASATL